MSIARRLFLRSAAAAGAVAAPVVVEAMQEDPRERLDAAVAELKAVTPTMRGLIENVIEDLLLMRRLRENLVHPLWCLDRGLREREVGNAVGKEKPRPKTVDHFNCLEG